VVRLKDLLKEGFKEIQKGKSFDEEIEADSQSGVPFIEIKNLTKNGIIFGEGIGALEDKYVLRKWYDNNKKFQLQEGDILIAITGATIGKSAVVTKAGELATFCGDIARIRIDTNQCDPIYVESFMRSKYGQIQIYKWINGSTNLHLATDALEEIFISVHSDYFVQAKKIEALRAKINDLENQVELLHGEEKRYFEELIEGN
jgi:type I restriction enzyme S subunit